MVTTACIGTCPTNSTNTTNTTEADFYEEPKQRTWRIPTMSLWF